MAMRVDSVCQTESQSAPDFRDVSHPFEGASKPELTTDDLGFAFARVGEEVPEELNVRFRVILEGHAQELRPEIKEKAYRIGREALMNAFRHSKASQVELHLECSAKGLRLAIRDNGKGISPELFPAGCEGLSWMKALAEHIGAKFKLLSRVKAGTEVLLSIPGHIAFAPRVTVNGTLLAA